MKQFLNFTKVARFSPKQTDFPLCWNPLRFAKILHGLIGAVPRIVQTGAFDWSKSVKFCQTVPDNFFLLIDEVINEVIND